MYYLKCVIEIIMDVLFLLKDHMRLSKLYQMPILISLKLL